MGSTALVLADNLIFNFTCPSIRRDPQLDLILSIIHNYGYIHPVDIQVC